MKLELAERADQRKSNNKPAESQLHVLSNVIGASIRCPLRCASSTVLLA